MHFHDPSTQESNHAVNKFLSQISRPAGQISGRKLCLSCTRPAANGWPLLWINRPLQVSQLANSAFHTFGVDKWVISWNWMCVTMWHHLLKATKVTAGLVESNGSLQPVGWLIVTCKPTACTLGSASGPTLGN